MRRFGKFSAALAALAVALAAAGAVAVGTGDAPEAPPEVTINLDVYEKVVMVLGVPYAAWTYGGTTPGPIIRVTEGTILNLVLRNGHSETHSIHTHLNHYGLAADGSSQTAPLSIVPHQNDNALGAVHSSLSGPTAGINPIGPYAPRGDHDVARPGETVTYRYAADEIGTFVYHCHVFPAVEHIDRGLMGMIVVYPKGWTWDELPKSPTFGNTKAWVTSADGTRYFEDVVILSAIDPTSLQEKASVSTLGDAGKIFLANFRAWNDPYVVGPVRTGTDVRLLVANLGDEMHSWHVHGHNFDIRDKFDPEQKIRYRTDVQVMGGGESYVTTFQAGQPGFWFMHDHIVPSAYAGNVPWLQVTE